MANPRDLLEEEMLFDAFGQELSERDPDDNWAGYISPEEAEINAMMGQPQAVAPVAPTPVAQAPAPVPTRSDISSMMDEYRQLQENRMKAQSNLGILAGAQEIGQAFAGGTSGNFKVDDSNLKMLQQLADRPVQDYTDRVKQSEMDIKLQDMQKERDPAAAAQLRDLAKTRGYKLTGQESQRDLEAMQKISDPLKTAVERQNVLKGDIGLRDLETDRATEGPVPTAYQAAAVKTGWVNAEQAKNMSRRDLEALLKLYQQSKAHQLQFKPQQTDYVNVETRNPVIFDQANSRYIDAVTQQPIGSGQLVRKIAQRDAFGNLIYAGLGGENIVAAGSSYGETDPTKLDAKYDQMKKSGQEFAPNLDQRKGIDEEKKRLDKLTEGAKTQMNSANSVLNALDSNSKLALSVVKAKMPRVMGEVGNLNQTEQEMWQGSQAWLDRINQYLSTITTSELTPENKNELKKLLSGFTRDAHDSYTKIRNNSSQGMAMTYGIPPKYMNSVYGELPVPRSVDRLIGSEINKSDAPVEQKVRVQAPDGSIRLVPEKDVPAAEKAGGKRLQ